MLASAIQDYSMKKVAFRIGHCKLGGPECVSEGVFDVSHGSLSGRSNAAGCLVMVLVVRHV